MQAPVVWAERRPAEMSNLDGGVNGAMGSRKDSCGDLRGNRAIREATYISQVGTPLERTYAGLFLFCFSSCDTSKYVIFTRTKPPKAVLPLPRTPSSVLSCMPVSTRTLLAALVLWPDTRVTLAVAQGGLAGIKHEAPTVAVFRHVDTFNFAHTGPTMLLPFHT